VADLLLALVGHPSALGHDHPWWAVRPTAYSFRRHAKRFSGSSVTADVKTKALIAEASVGTQVDSLDLSQWDADLQKAPTTTSGAWYRVAYWTAAAAQIANQKRPEISNALILSAGKALAMAESTLIASAVTSWLVDPSEIRSIREILLTAVPTLATVGEPQLLAMFQRMASPTAIVAEQHVEAASALGLQTLTEAAARAKGYLEVPVQYVRGAAIQFVDAGRQASIEEMEKAKEVVATADRLAQRVAQIDQIVSEKPPIEIPASVLSTLAASKGFLATFAQPIAVLRKGLGMPVPPPPSGSVARFGIAGVDDAVVIVVVVGIAVVALAAAAIVLAGAAAYSYSLYARMEQSYLDLQAKLAACVADPRSTPEQRAACLRMSRKVKPPKGAPDPFGGLADLAPWIVGGGAGLAALYFLGPMISEGVSAGTAGLRLATARREIG